MIKDDIVALFHWKYIWVSEQIVRQTVALSASSNKYLFEAKNFNGTQ